MPTSSPATAQTRAGPARAGESQAYAMVLAYDGGPFHGWQLQAHGPSVQGRLEEALAVLTRQFVRVHGSGRTDAGVHALAQVAHFQGPPGLDLEKLRTGLNALAGPAIAVHGVVPVPARFHARHNALGKVYRYHIFNRPYPPVFARGRCWWLRAPLAVAPMAAAAEALLGEHDFSAFRARNCGAVSPVRKVRRLSISEGEQPDSTLRIEIEASGFLQHMARILCGTLVAVGMGRLAPREIPAILASGRRDRAAATAPGQGLHLVRVDYDLVDFPELASLLRSEPPARGPAGPW